MDALKLGLAETVFRAFASTLVELPPTPRVEIAESKDGTVSLYRAGDCTALIHVATSTHSPEARWFRLTLEDD